jgi:hypothetical protein
MSSSHCSIVGKFFFARYSKSLKSFMNFLLHVSTIGSSFLKIQPLLVFHIAHVINIIISMKNCCAIRLLSMLMTLFQLQKFGTAMSMEVQQDFAKLNYKNRSHV